MKVNTMKVNTMCKFKFNSAYNNYKDDYPFKETDIFVYLGDITNMPGHCIVVRWEDKQIFLGYHTCDFIPLTDEEL